MIKHTPNAEYLGDGVYVDISDNNDIVLTTENGVHVTNEIVLESYVVQAFLNYITKLKEASK